MGFLGTFHAFSFITADTEGIQSGVEQCVRT